MTLNLFLSISVINLYIFHQINVKIVNYFWLISLMKLIYLPLNLDYLLSNFKLLNSVFHVLLDRTQVLP